MLKFLSNFLHRENKNKLLGAMISGQKIQYYVLYEGEYFVFTENHVNSSYILDIYRAKEVWELRKKECRLKCRECIDDAFQEDMFLKLYCAMKQYNAENNDYKLQSISKFANNEDYNYILGGNS